MAEWKQKRQHMRHYNRTAQIYNIRYSEEQKLKIKAAVESLKFKGQSSVLDLGFGTGLLIPEIQKTTKEIAGLDISKNMLKEADPLIKRSLNIHLILADADQTPLRNGYFDIVFAMTLLQNMPNPHQTLQEAKRITKNDALIVVTGLKKHFTEHFFLKLLENAKLKARLLRTDDNLKCHIATCKKCNRKQ